MTAHVLGQIVIIEVPGHQPLPVMVFSLTCDRCGEDSFVIALHHAKGLQHAIGQLLENLPPELAKAADTRDTTVLAPRTKPEAN